jgi:hypothetical protein
VIVVMGFAAASVAQSSPGPIQTISFSDTTFSVAAVSITIVNTTVNLQLGLPTMIEFKISSPVNGPFMIGVTSQGKDLMVGMIAQGHSTDLPAGLSAQFPSGALLQAANQAVVSVVLTASSGMPTGNIPLQLVVYQQQHPLSQPGAFSGAVAPFEAHIGG